MTKKEESAMKRALKLEAEKARVEQMCEYEKNMVCIHIYAE